MTTVLKYSASEIVEDAFLDSGIIPPDQVPEAEDVATGFRILNRLLKLWQVNMHLWLQEEGVIFLNQGQQSYELGPNGDEITSLDDFIPTTLTAAIEIGDQIINVASTEGITAPEDLFAFNSLDADFWDSSDGAVITNLVNEEGGLELVVTNSLPLGSSGLLLIDLDVQLEDAENYTIRVDNISGEGEKVEFSVQDPSIELTGRILLGTGDNEKGQLGIGSTADESTFTQEITFAEEWNVFSAGLNHALAIKQDGTLWVTGDNTFGQLGLGFASNTPEEIYIQVGDEDDWLFVAAGGNFSVAIKSDFTLWSSGGNDFGQLGLGTFDNVSVFTQELLGFTDWVGVDCGIGYAMAMRGDNDPEAGKTIYGVGDNGDGQLGTNTGTNELDFVEETNLTRDWVSSSAGLAFTMAIDDTKKLWATGDNESGQFGRGDKASEIDFTQIGTNNWSAVACGDEFTYVIEDITKKVFAAGLNTNGQLAQGDTTQKLSFQPALIDRDDYAVVANGDDFSLIITTDGELFATGNNANGQLGLGDTTDRDEYIQVGAATNWVHIACGSVNSVAVDGDGKLWSAGDNTFGQIGDNTTTQRTSLTQESSGATDWGSVACGDFFTMAFKVGANAGKIYGVGRNQHGQLGDNSETDRHTFVQAGTDSDWALLDTGATHTMAIKSDFTLWGTGHNNSAELCNGLKDDVKVFTQGYMPVNDIVKEFAVSLEGSFAAVIKADGTLWTAGKNNLGQLGLGFTSDQSTKFRQEDNGFTNWLSVTCGRTHMLATRSDMSLYSTGSNTHGQLGLGNNDNKSTLTQVGSDTDWTKITASNISSYGVRSGGQLSVAGDNSHGQLGRYFDIADALEFVNAYELSNQIMDIASGEEFIMFIKSDGTLWGMGQNTNGQLGTDDTVRYELPVQEATKSSNWTDVKCGENFTVALKTTGELFGTGDRNEGQLGMIGGADLTTFTKIGTDTDWRTFDCGHDFTMAIKDNDLMYATGSNADGQLGIDSLDPNRFVFTETDGNITWLTVACGLSHTIAIGTEHDLYGTGSNDHGQLGLNNTDQQIKFQKEESEATNWSRISAGFDFSMATKTDSTMWGTGVNSKGQLGVNDNTERHTYVTASKNLNWGVVACRQDFTLAISNQTSTPTIYGTGNNQFGQLGINQSNNEKKEFTTNNDGAPALLIACGFDFAGYVSVNEELFTVGHNDKGQLGLGNTVDKHVFTQAPTAITNVIDIAAGTDFSMIVRDNETIFGTGNNQSGKLGIGSQTDIDFFLYLQETTFGINWKSVACGENHTIATTNDKNWYGTGFNNFGQLGIGNNASRGNFTQATNAGDTEQIACGENHTVSINTAGEVWSAGDNSVGQLSLGAGSPISVNHPTQESTLAKTWRLITAGGNMTMAAGTTSLMISGDNNQGQGGTTLQVAYSAFTTTLLLDPGATAVSCGTNFTMVITDESKIFGVGEESQGQLGSQGGAILLLQEALENKDWTTISCGSAFTVALNTSFQLFATGDGTSGQLGNVATQISTFTQETTGAEDWESISAGSAFASAVKTQNRMSATGDNTVGQLGIPYISPNTDEYTGVHPQLTADQIACGSSHAIALVDGIVFGTGNNADGQLAINNILEKHLFTQSSSSITDWDTIACGSDHTMAIDGDQKLHGAGLNDRGQLGINNTTVQTNFIQETTGRTDWLDVSCGNKHTAALTEVAATPTAIYTTGDNGSGQLAQNITTANVVEFARESSNAPNWEEVACGGDHTLGRKSDDTLWAAGDNSNGALGLNDVEDRIELIKIGTDTDWGFLTAGSTFSMVIKSNGNNSLWGAGANNKGQLGIGTSSVRDLYSQEFLADTNWVSISCGNNTAIALKTSGTLWGTGSNKYGQIGLGTQNNNQPKFVQEVGDGGGGSTLWKQASSGGGHTAAVMTNRTLWSAGLNENGQLGIGNKGNQILFTREANVGDLWESAAAGDQFSIALRNDGTLWGTGQNAGGELGLGEPTIDVIFYTQEVLKDINWDAISVGGSFSIASQKDTFFKVIDEEIVTTDGPVFLEFSRNQLTTNNVLFVITIDEDETGSAASIDRLELRNTDGFGDFIGIRTDDDTRFWTKVVEITSDTELTIQDPMQDMASIDNTVFTFSDLIDRPLRIYNGRTLTFGDDNEIPVDDWSRQEYMQQPLKSSQGIPVNMYYTPELGDGRVYVWQTAANSNQMLNFTYDKPFEVTPDTASQPDIPPEWANALKWAIAKEMIAGYGVPLDRAQMIVMQADIALQEVQDNSNSSVYDLNVIPDMR